MSPMASTRVPLDIGAIHFIGIGGIGMSGIAEIMRLKSCIAVAGTNGKTTTTTMVAALLDAGNLDPTVVNGGIINAYGTNARLGQGEWVVVEADESDGTFLRLPSTIAIVTNADPDHLDFYITFDRLREAFQRFIENVPFYGFAVLCIDHPEVQAMVGRVTDRRIITYGLSPQADVRAVNVRFEQGSSLYDVIFTNRLAGTEHRLDNLKLPMPGEHNVQNSLAAITVANQLGVPDETIAHALETFRGVGRRFTRVGEWNGAAIIDDYAHNPFKIAAALKAARQAYSGPVVAVVQPHRFTRLRDTFAEFAKCLNDADVAVIAPVYAAGEKPIEGFDRDSYADALRAHGHRHVLTIDGGDDLAAAIAPHLKPGGAVICLGAGSISAWANKLQAALEALS